MEARVSDFGVATLMEPDKTHVPTFDGKKPTDDAFIEGGTRLVTWVKTVVEDKREEHLVDSNLEDCPVEEINSAFIIAIMCIESEPSKMPSMAEVVKMLEQLKTKKAV